jgi:hypothetical protein
VADYYRHFLGRGRAKTHWRLLPDWYDIACAAYAFTLMVTLTATGEHSLSVPAARAWETLLGAGLGATAALVVLPLRPGQPLA